MKFMMKVKQYVKRVLDSFKKQKQAKEVDQSVVQAKKDCRRILGELYDINGELAVIERELAIYIKEMETKKDFLIKRKESLEKSYLVKESEFKQSLNYFNTKSLQNDIDSTNYISKHDTNRH